MFTGHMVFLIVSVFFSNSNAEQIGLHLSTVLLTIINVTLEVLILFFATWQTLVGIFLLLQALFIVYAVVREHTTELSSLLLNKIKIRAYQHHHFFILNRFYHEYYHLLFKTLRPANEHCFSRTLLFCLAAFLLFNLLVCEDLLLRVDSGSPQGKSFDNHSNFLEKAELLLMTAFQVVLVLAVIAGLVAITQCFYRADGLLFRVQLMLKGSAPQKEEPRRNDCAALRWLWSLYREQQQQCTRAKLKLAVFYETVCTEDPFRFTVGSLAKVSWEWSLEFAFFYAGFVLYVAKMIRSGRM